MASGKGPEISNIFQVVDAKDVSGLRQYEQQLHTYDDEGTINRVQLVDIDLLFRGGETLKRRE
jgi:hypothetical protein